jgi:hypothetical protein
MEDLNNESVELDVVCVETYTKQVMPSFYIYVEHSQGLATY